MDTLNFLKSELVIFNLELSSKPNGSEVLDYLIGSNEIYLQSIDLDTERSIKIPKQELGELKANLFIALVLMIDKEPRAVYFIPSVHLAQSNSDIFINNEVSEFPSLSNSGN